MCPFRLLLPSAKHLPREAELALQINRYLWRGSVNFKIKNSRPLFTIIFKSKMVISRLEILFYFFCNSIISRRFHLDWEYLVILQMYNKFSNPTSEWFWPHCDSKMAARSTVQWGILNMKHSHNGDKIVLELHLNAYTPTISRHFHLDWEYLVKWQTYKKKIDNATSEWSWPHCDSTMAARSTVQWGILVICM